MWKLRIGAVIASAALALTGSAGAWAAGRDGRLGSSPAVSGPPPFKTSIGTAVRVSLGTAIRISRPRTRPGHRQLSHSSRRGRGHRDRGRQAGLLVPGFRR